MDMWKTPRYASQQGVFITDLEHLQILKRIEEHLIRAAEGLVDPNIAAVAIAIMNAHEDIQKLIYEVAGV